MSLYSVDIYYCNDFEERCLGGLISSCEVGYTGPLCSLCQWGYSRLGLNSCIKCQNQFINMLSIIGMFILFSVIMGLFVM